MNKVTYIDHILYKAAEEGNIVPFENCQTCLDRLLTPDKNTILHVYLRNQTREPESTNFVDKILEMCPPLLFQANKKGEIPHHLAARYGHSNVVGVLIYRAKALPTDPESGVTEAKKMLGMTNEEQDTALHEAVRNSQSHVVELLTTEDPEFSYSANVHGEPPLYIAVFVKRREVIDEILRNCISVDYGDPNGGTALHAASSAGDDGTARKILDYYPSAAYIADTEKKRTALHIAAIHGNVDVVKEIVSRCPACCELVDHRGWNALHYAVASQQRNVLEECLEIPELARLKTEKDDKGNTPFHLIAALAHKQKQWRRVLDEHRDECESEIFGLNKRKLRVYDILFINFAEIKKEIFESVEDVASGPLGNLNVRVRGQNEEENKEEEEAMSKARESHLVVAALIATVTFAAAFTLPGGYNSDPGPNKGTAILAKKAAFIVFVISDAMSMVLSIFAVFIHFLMALNQGFKLDRNTEMYEVTSLKLFMLATLLTMIGMGTMIIAFLTGTYAVLEPSFGLAISACLIDMSFFFLVCVVFRIIYKDVKDMV